MAGAARRPPLVLALGASAVVALLLLPLAYLVTRVAGGGGRALDVLWDDSTARLVVDTVLLVLGVVVASIVVAVPTAWLVTRTDLPGRRLWAVAAALPLVIPSYVAALCLLGFFGRGGLLEESLGIEQLLDPTGYWGAVAALTLSTYPYVFLLTQAALRDLDPALEEAARSLGVSRGRVLLRVTVPAVRPAVSLGSLLVALYVLSDFGVVSLMRYDSLTRAIYLQYRSLFDRTPAAVLALVLVALTAVALALELRARARGRLWRTGPGAARRAHPVALGRAKPLALAWCGLVTLSSCSSPPRVLAYWLARGLANDRGVDLPWREALNSLTASGLAGVVAIAAALPSRPRHALPVTGLAARRAALLRRERPPGPRDRALARVLRRTLRVAAVPDAGAAGVRLRGAVLPPGAVRDRPRARAGQPTCRGGCPRARTRADRHDMAGDDSPRPAGAPRRRGARVPVGDEGAPGHDPPASHRLRHARDRDLGCDAGRRVLTGSRARAGADRGLGTRSLASQGDRSRARERPGRVAGDGRPRTLDRRISRGHLLPRLPDRGVPARRRQRDRVARGRDARCLARVRRGDAEAARSRRPGRAGRAKGGDPHERPGSSGPSGSSASTGSSSAS